MRDLGIGRTPLREAVKRLALENLVAVQPRSGTYVTGVDAADIAHIAEVRAELEAHAAELAARRLTDTLRARAEALLERCAGMAPSAARRADGPRRVDPPADLGGLAQPVPDRDARALLRALAARLVRRADRVPGLTTAVLDHAGLLEAVLAGDRVHAGELMREHVIAFEREIVAAFSRG